MFSLGLNIIFFLLYALNFASSAFEPARRQDATIPDYVFTYAPIVYLDLNDPYCPSDIGAQIQNTRPDVNLRPLSDPPANLSLADLETLNNLAGCTSFADCSLYLTSRADVMDNPPWLAGVYPNPMTGQTEDATSAAIIVNDHGDGTVDAFYMYFYAYNLGLFVFGSFQGNHVGDWEHSMVRFVNGEPQSLWLSQHTSGEAYSYKAMEKGGEGGMRPIVYSGRGGHATYATPGVHTRMESIIELNDTTSKGPMWDPLLGAYFYMFTPDGSGENGTFASPSVPDQYRTTANDQTPISWLYYLGKWGDEQYPDTRPGQINLANISYTYTDGPTGPLDKGLQRQEVCPDNDSPCTTMSQLPAVSGPPQSKTIARTYIPPDSTATPVVPSSDIGNGRMPQQGGAAGAVAFSSRLAGVGILLGFWNTL